MNEYVYSPMKAAHIHTHKSVQDRQRTELYGENYILMRTGHTGAVLAANFWGLTP